jgi:hypothetical protein
VIGILLAAGRGVGGMLVGRMSGARFVAVVVSFGLRASLLGRSAPGVGFGSIGRIVAVRVGGRLARSRLRLAGCRGASASHRWCAALRSSVRAAAD